MIHKICHHHSAEVEQQLSVAHKETYVDKYFFFVAALLR